MLAGDATPPRALGRRSRTRGDPGRRAGPRIPTLVPVNVDPHPVPSTQQGGRRRPRVVVVGGGFAGMSAVRELRKADVDVLLIDKNGYTTFQPLLYQVATGGLNPGDVTFYLRAFTSRFKNADFLRAVVTGVDTEAKKVRLDDDRTV